MESNVFDVVSLTSTCSHCPPSWSPVPGPLSPPKKINPKGLYLKDLTLKVMKVEVLFSKCRPKSVKKSS